ncbi:UDP-glucose 4-epimerase, partial [Aureobasidium melanogenum]
MPSHRQPSTESLQKTAQRYRDEIKSFPVCLVTGGAGYIGSHTVLQLLNAGTAVVVVDNLCNSHMESLIRVHYIARIEAKRLNKTDAIPPIYFHQADIRHTEDMLQVFAFWQSIQSSVHPRTFPVSIGDVSGKKAYPMLEYSLDTTKRVETSPAEGDPSAWGKISAVIHFAALKAVSESISKPLEYYENNVAALVGLLKVMEAHSVHVLIFSSSAVVYGIGHEAGIAEDTVQVAGKGSGGGLLTNPYGRSKWMSEEIINDYCLSRPSFHAVSLRYFNPTGSHPSGLIGEDPKGTPNNIVPVILQAYQRRRSRVHVFGSNYDTADGTGVRDYIHVSDLAMGHLAALRKASKHLNTASEYSVQNVQQPGSNYIVYNLGTGRGYSVLEIIAAFSAAAGVSIPFTIDDARAGDLGTVTASPEKAASDLEWRAEFDLQDMCRDVFNWAAANPAGYETLRRLSTMPDSGGIALRKASVANGLFEREEEFDDFFERSLSSIDTFHSAQGTSSDASSFSDLLRKMRSASITSYSEKMSSSDDPHDLPSDGGSSIGGSSKFTMPWNAHTRSKGDSTYETIAEAREFEEEDLDPWDLRVCLAESSAFKERFFMMFLGLLHLETRGYDSAGLAIDGDENETLVFKEVGKVARLKNLIEQEKPELTRLFNFHAGIAHTRWASHNPPDHANCQPHSASHRSDPKWEFTIVHDGVITNYKEIRMFLHGKGFRLETQNDTEAIAKIAKYIHGRQPNIDFPALAKAVVKRLRGTFGLLLKSVHYPHEIIAARKSSPLVVGIRTPEILEINLVDVKDYEEDASPGENAIQSMVMKNSPRPGYLAAQSEDILARTLASLNRSQPSFSHSGFGVPTPIEFFISSNLSAVIEHTKKVLYLEDDDVAHISNGQLTIHRLLRDSIKSNTGAVRTLELEMPQIVKGSFDYFMQKEIFEQPETV